MLDMTQLPENPSPIKCPRCKSENRKKDHICKECRLPLKSYNLSQYALNIEMQWDRIKEDKSELLYEDSKLRLLPSSTVDNQYYTKHIVYYKNERFVLLDFVNIIHKKKAIIHFRIRLEKGIIIFYKRNHKLSDLFFSLLEGIAETLDLKLVDITETLDHNKKLQKMVEAYPKG